MREESQGDFLQKRRISPPEAMITPFQTCSFSSLPRKKEKKIKKIVFFSKKRLDKTLLP